MPGIRVKEHENFEAAMRRFKRMVEKAGVLAELRKREFYVKPCEQRKRAFDAAVKRLRKKLGKDGRPETHRSRG